MKAELQFFGLRGLFDRWRDLRVPQRRELPVRSGLERVTATPARISGFDQPLVLLVMALLAFGLVMLFYWAQTKWLRHRHEDSLAGLSKEQIDVKLLSLAMPSWPVVFGVLAVLLVIFVRLRYRKGLTGLIGDTPDRGGQPPPPLTTVSTSESAP